MLGAVAPRNDPFAGGTLAAAASPVAVSGSFGAPGTSGFPAPSPGQAIMARNNQGTNVRIPYARLVPMRGKSTGPDSETKWSYVPGVKMRDGIVGRPFGNEYDGLDSGELAWIKGRSYRAKDSPMASMGFGPDRMQRLASQFYMENYFRATFGKTIINLCKINIGDETLMSLSSDLQLYKNYLAGASVLGSVDLPYLANGLQRNLYNQTVEQLEYTDTEKAAGVRTNSPEEGLSCGLLVIEKGPFLRGKIVDTQLVEMVAPEVARTMYGGARKHDVPRNLGDMVAFDALYAAMKQQGFFDWSPDGLIMSKLESPSGDVLSSSELDARQAQLFNVAIQGPAITKTWTGDPAMQVLPLDRVFVVVVADISTETTSIATDGVGAVGALSKAWAAYNDAHKSGTSATKEALANVKEAVEKANGEFTDKNGGKLDGAYAAAVTNFFAASRNVASNSEKDQEPILDAALETAQSAMNEFFASIDVKEIDAAAKGLKQGKLGVATSSMTNFRLMRVTSSYLINNSAPKFRSGELVNTSRCGLRIGGKKTEGAQEGVGVFTGSYIVGGWCIGSVLDSAASRSVIGQQIRTAPCSMAINLNVNIEWWSGDDLYKRYNDTDGTVLQRGATLDGPNALNVLADRTKGVDVNEAARLESASFTTTY